MADLGTASALYPLLGGICITAYTVRMRDASKPLKLFLGWQIVFFLLLIYSLSQDVSSGNLTHSDTISSLAAWGIGLSVAALLSAYPQAILVAVLFVSGCTILLFSGHESTLVSGGVQRAAGGLHDVAMTGCVLSILMPLAVGSATANISKLIRSFGTAAAAISAIAICFTGSWAAVAAAAIGTCTVMYRSGLKSGLAVALVATIVMIAAVVAMRVHSEASARSNSASKYGRMELLNLSFHRAYASWPLGEGIGTQPLDIVNPVTHEHARSQDPHCEYLYLVQQFGIVGVLMALSFAVLVVLLLRCNVGPSQYALQGAFVALAVLGLFESPLLFISRYPTMISFGLLSGKLMLSGLAVPKAVKS